MCELQWVVYDVRSCLRNPWVGEAPGTLQHGELQLGALGTCA